MTKKRVIIAWESKLTGNTGQCTTLMSAHQAILLCEKADREFPNIKHTIKKPESAC